MVDLVRRQLENMRTFSPNWDSYGVQLEQHSGGFDIEISIAAPKEELTGCSKCGAPTFEYRPGVFEFTCDHYAEAEGNGKRLFERDGTDLRAAE
jgi:hypothetical protein